MVELVKLLKPGTYVEVGVQRGYTFNVIAPLVEKAVAVDVQKMKSIADAPNVVKYQMTSEEFAKQWWEPIDLLFIDADHHAEAVSRDFHNLSGFVREGTGLILLHDTHPMMEELLQDEFCSSAWITADQLWRYSVNYRDGVPEGYEIVTLPGPWFGLSIVRKRGKHHLSWRRR
jgi:hypothetical protein